MDIDQAPTTDTISSPPPPLQDEEAHLKARTSDSKFWLDFSLFDDGLDAPRAASLTTLPQFHRFPDLPPEIRLKIWSYLIAPRVVTACCFERDARLPARREAFANRSLAAPRTLSPYSYSPTNTAPERGLAGEGTTEGGTTERGATGEGAIGSTTEGEVTGTETKEEQDTRIFNPTCPLILLISRESRALGLKHYELAFGWRISALLSDTPIARPPRVWFNFALDALYLVGELEAYDQYGFNSPMVYFLRKEDTRRVRHVACAFEELHYPEQESDQIFGCLWHVVDRFAGAKRLMVAVTPRDEEGMKGCLMLSPDNIMQKIWNGWILGTTVTSSSLADTQILMVREGDLADVMACHAEEDEEKGGKKSVVTVRP
ncbi:hypothetical protein HER10_EVM0011121 [Colletotrichum scovillei]|uniref:Protein kinase-like domain protein n=1 Tax=Colletotrichum scovillei TaxID=1209932 RepID=A0A9P7REJ4_9PEZI|nr:uncharacterized protein HER10_EVM0011121 [Colletotrichum scovillei]KAF4777056.1 hypothetical protein HER10_EVM0011121 [Colletotrichum scovillei]KAG7054199.1 Protein kinase-like domain protein [Colletotrichum scovillei]KAG7072494.1 Protein kinase-like domain protein [Colletotrichum scovillei]KAG7080828.1 Protein kinase-like domain protein [Colletotrichum scovillei]